MEIGTWVKVTEGDCKGKTGKVKELYRNFDNEIELLLRDGITTVIINSDYMEAL